MVKLYPEEIPELWYKITSDRIHGGYMSFSDFAYINRQLAKYHGFITQEMKDGEFSYYLEFKSDNQKLAFMIKYG